MGHLADLNIVLSFLTVALASSCSNAQETLNPVTGNKHIYTAGQLDTLMKKPACMGEYFSSQSGPLRKRNSEGAWTYDSTFTVESIDVPSEGFLIRGWLYLPLNQDKCPLIILTNGGGDNSAPIKSFSDFMAPVLAHCGIAAFVHDKRGTGESQGDYAETTYEDYINDAGNCAKYLSDHMRIDSARIGVMGASEGGRVAVIAASRFPVFKFVISQAGTVVSAVDDRLYAQINGMIDQGIMSESEAEIVKPLWKKSFMAWASNDPAKHEEVNIEISEWRKKYDRRMLPYTNQEMESIEEFRIVMPTWHSLRFDYMTEMSLFRKKWLAIFGELDRVVPTDASISNIVNCMSESGNSDYNVAILPNCGHAPVDVDTKMMVNFHYLIINWLCREVLNVNISHT